MLDTYLEKFPKTVTLNDGSACTIRRMEAGDRRAFQKFHAVIPEREQLFVRSRIKDGTLFDSWMADSEIVEHLPLLAVSEGGLVALAALRLRPGGWKRHIGRVQFLTHPEFTGLGLIDHLLRLMMEVSRHAGLTRLESELNGERVNAMEAMARVGFRELVRIPDYIQDMQAQYHDYVLMGTDLVAAYENLGAGD